MSGENLSALLTAAQARRDSGEWSQAARLFQQAATLAPQSAEIAHNLAIAQFALGEHVAARAAAQNAVRIAPALWQSHALLARLHQSGGEPEAAETGWRAVLQHSPRNGAALLGLADLAMNEFGDAQAAFDLVAPLRDDPSHAGDAELTSLMASLYLGEGSASAVSTGLARYSHRNLRIPALPPRQVRAGKRRIAIVSPLLSASPVYYLCYSALQAIAGVHDLVVFSRSSRSDWATERLHALAREWHAVAHVEPVALARRIADAEIDILLDLGGWSDAAGLAALSAKPAARMYKWVGGQSATTGLNMFDGWIGDAWQSPTTHQPLYTEPLVQMENGYVDYAPPDYLAGCRDLPKAGVALVGNPAKLSAAGMAFWPSGVERVRLIDRRYAHARTRTRVLDLLGRYGIGVEAVIVPRGHEAYLKALGSCEAMVNTQPYAAGLTAVEALAMGVRVLAMPGAGDLFCNRHHLSHLRTRGANPGLPAQMLRLVSS